MELDIYDLNNNFIETRSVDPNSSVKKFKESLLTLTSGLLNINLFFTKCSPKRKETFIQIQISDNQAQVGVLYSSDNDYPIIEVLNNVKTSYQPDDELIRYFDLIPLERYRVYIKHCDLF